MHLSPKPVVEKLSREQKLNIVLNKIIYLNSIQATATISRIDKEFRSECFERILGNDEDGNYIFDYEQNQEMPYDYDEQLLEIIKQLIDGGWLLSNSGNSFLPSLKVDSQDCYILNYMRQKQKEETENYTKKLNNEVLKITIDNQKLTKFAFVVNGIIAAGTSVAALYYLLSTQYLIKEKNLSLYCKIFPYWVTGLLALTTTGILLGILCILKKFPNNNKIEKKP